jgi:hypothetical protein
MTRRLTCGETGVVPLSARETVDGDTLARLETSLMVDTAPFPSTLWAAWRKKRMKAISRKLAQGPIESQQRKRIALTKAV